MTTRLKSETPSLSSEESKQGGDLFQKCLDFTRADDVKRAGFYPYFHPIQENEGPVVQIEGRKIIMAGSNNYLGLTAHPYVKEAARKAVEKYGTGCSGSRYLTGTIDLHCELEARLAKFMRKEACLLFSTGYQTAQGIIPTLVKRGEYVVTDKDNHASIVAGYMIAKGMSSDVVRYKHNDMSDLERVIRTIPLNAGKLIVTDGVFSTTGEIVKLPELVALAKKYNARILVDDAHAVGVLGEGGRGTASHFGLVGEVDMTMGTFSKTFASLGGFVVGNERVIDYIKHTSAALIFSASPTPASVAAALAALDILEKEPARINVVIRNAHTLRTGLRELGFRVQEGQTPVIPVIIGDDMLTFQLWKSLFDAGVYVNAFVSPAVPPGQQLMRISVMATHEDSHLKRILEVFRDVGKSLGLIR